MNIIEEIKKNRDYLVALRRDFHQYPELSWEELRTSARIKEELETMGIPYVSMAKTGVLATIEGGLPGKTVALRADMDALPVYEKNDAAYASKNEGRMHACGHDGHTAMLLAAGKLLNQRKDELRGSVKLIFQPAEEIGQGAKQMIAEGCLEGVDNILGIHLWSDFPVGKVSVEEGPRMASADLFEIRVEGRGGHGSLPHQGVDALLVGSALVMNLQSIVSRELSPLESAVVSIGTFQSGTGYNVVANEAHLKGTSRCFDKEVREKLPVIIERIATSTAETYRAKADLAYNFAPPATINDSESSLLAAGSVRKFLGEEGLSKMEKLTVGEDFAYYLQEVPGLLAFVGAGNPAKGAAYPHHHEKFNIDEDALEIGCLLYVQYALDFLNS